MRRTVPILLLAVVLVLWATSLLRARRAPWTRPAGPTADRVLAHIHASGAITLTYGPTAAEQASILPGPVRLDGTLPEPNAGDLDRLLGALEAFAKPRQDKVVWRSLDTKLEVLVDEEATTAWLSWLLYMVQLPKVGMTRVVLRRMPSGRLVPLDLPEIGEWEGPRPGHKEEPRTRVRLRRGRLPPMDDRQVIKVSRFSHYVADTHEIYDEDGERAPPARNRYVADLPSIAAWGTPGGRRLLDARLRRVRALLKEDLNCLDSIPLDVIVEPIYTRFADMPATVVLDVLEGLRDLPGIRLQYEAMVEGWWR